MLSKIKVKYIQSLGHKKGRAQEGLFIAEGPKLVADILAHQPQAVETIYALPQWVAAQAAALAGVAVVEITENELQQISQLNTPHQVVAVVKQWAAAEVQTHNRVVLVLDGIQDPGNMGTIIRTADWFGIQQVVCSMDSVEQYNPKVVQATMGSIARVQVHYKHLPTWIAEQQVPVWVTALDGQPLAGVGRVKEGLIVIGNEGNGVSQAVMQLATQYITILRIGSAESLNAAVATGVVLSYVM
ncbi:MAG: hypothetical protein RL115_1545 [Bacteroidota bacterium]